MRDKRWAPGIAVLCTCTILMGSQAVTPSTVAPPVLQGFDGTDLPFPAEPGVPYALFSSPGLQLNAHTGSLVDAEETWFLKLACITPQLILEASIAADATDVEFVEDYDRESRTTRTRMHHVYGSIPISITINGERETQLLYSGTMMAFPNLTVTFPEDPLLNRPEDGRDGPIAIIRTNTVEITMFYSSLKSLHLDFAIRVLSDELPLGQAHGILGQTLAWMDSGSTDNHATSESISDDGKAVDQETTRTMIGDIQEYAVTDGLTGTAFAYSKYDAELLPITHKRRMMLEEPHTNSRTVRGAIAVSHQWVKRFLQTR